jgi:hypothetical protein
MLNFPSSPANGDTFSGFTFDSTEGTWKHPEPSFSTDAASDSKEYVMRNGVWVVKRQFATSLPTDFAVPSGAVMVKWRVIGSSATDGQSNQIVMRCSEDSGSTYKSGASDYGYGGPIHNSGSTGYTGGSGSSGSLPITGSSSNALTPTFGEGFLFLKRPSTSQVFSGGHATHGYVNVAGTHNFSNMFKLFLTAASWAQLALTNIRFLNSQVNTMAGVYITVEWTY